MVNLPVPSAQTAPSGQVAIGKVRVAQLLDRIQETYYAPTRANSITEVSTESFTPFVEFKITFKNRTVFPVRIIIGPS